MSQAQPQNRTQALGAAAAAWNINSRRFLIVDGPTSGHIPDTIQNIPELFTFLNYYASIFRGELGQHPSIGRPSIPLAQVATQSHLYCPFIWRVLKLYKVQQDALPEASRINIPDIPDEWLSYGHRENQSNIGNVRNYSQTRDPTFYGIGNQDQQTFWATQVNTALANTSFLNALKKYIIPPHNELEAGLKQQRSGVQYQITNDDIKNTIGGLAQGLSDNMITEIRVGSANDLTFAISQILDIVDPAPVQPPAPAQQVNNANNNRARFLSLQTEIDNLKAFLGNSVTEEQIKQAIKNSNWDPDQAYIMLISALGLNGGKRKNRKTKRRDRKQKRKSTYRRRH